MFDTRVVLNIFEANRLAKFNTTVHYDEPTDSPPRYRSNP